MENAQAKHKLLKLIMTAKPLTRQEYDAIQRRRVEQRRRLEDITIQKRLKAI